MRVLVAATLGALACTGATEPASSAASSAKPDEDPNAPDPAALEKVCGSPCAGKFASVTVHRDASGKIGRFQFKGDLAVCSHPPHVYYDAAGVQTGTIAERPVTGPEDAEAFRLKIAEQLEGLTEAERLRCPQ